MAGKVKLKCYPCMYFSQTGESGNMYISSKGYTCISNEYSLVYPKRRLASESQGISYKRYARGIIYTPITCMSACQITCQW